MCDRADHAAHSLCVLERLLAPDLAQTQSAQRRFLDGGTPRLAADLAHLEHLLAARALFLCHRYAPAATSASFSLPGPSRRWTISDTLLPRRCAMRRGDCCCFSASKVARTIL